MTFYSSQRGILFATVLLFIEIISILGFYSLQNTVLKLKMSNALWHEYSLIEAAKLQLTVAEKLLQQQTPPCLVTVMPAADLRHKTLSWWKSSSCIGNFQLFQYYYVVEWIGNDNCAYIEHENSPNAIANYYRISLLITPTTHLAEKIILQSSVVKISMATGVCKEGYHVVKIGRQARRQLV
jgi:hypothetical protein